MEGSELGTEIFDSSPSQNEAERFWLSIESEVRQNLETLIAPFIDRISSRLDPEEKDRERIETSDKILQRERGFIEAVYNTVIQAAKTGKDAIFLLDLDFTAVKSSAFHERNDIIRPSLIPLLRGIKALYMSQSRKVEIGFLTNRPRDLVLSRGLADPKNLQPLEAFVDKRRVYEARDERWANKGYEGYQEKIEKNFGPRGSAIITDASGDLWNPTDCLKLQVIDKTRKSEPGKTIIAVDDNECRYPAFLDRTKGLYGVQLDEHTSFNPW